VRTRIPDQYWNREESLATSNLLRMSGLALVLGCVLFVISGLIQLYLLSSPDSYTTATGIVGVIALVAAPLVGLGLIGLYARQLEAAGILGLVAFVIAFFGSAFVMGLYWYYAFVVPSIAPVNYPWFAYFETQRPALYGDALTIAFVLLYLGWLLAGVTMLRTRVFPRLAAALLIAVSLVAGIISLVQPAVGLPDSSSGLSYAIASLVNILFYAIIAWLGLALWRAGSASEDPTWTQSRKRATWSTSLVRLCGLALVASSVLFLISIIGTLTVPRAGISTDPDASHVLYNLTSLVDVPMAALEILGLVGLYARRPQAMGILGLVAFLIAFFGGMLQAGSSWYARFVEWYLPFDLWLVLVPESPGPYALPYAVGSALTFPVYLLGWMLIGVAFLRARLYPRPASVLLIVVSLASMVLSVRYSLVGIPDVDSILPYMEIAMGVLQNALLAWLGFALWMGGKDPKPRSDTLVASQPVS
jgi:hypothetical protein